MKEGSFRRRRTNDASAVVKRRSTRRGVSRTSNAGAPSVTLDPLEVLLHFTPGEAQNYRTPVRADGGIRRPSQLFQDVAHLFERQRIVRLHGRVACHRGGNPAKCIVDSGTLVETLEVLGEGANGSFAFGT